MAKTKRPNGFMRTIEAAEYLGVHPRTVKALVRKGAIPYHKLSDVPHAWNYFLADELDEWLEETRQTRRAKSQARQTA